MKTKHWLKPYRDWIGGEPFTAIILAAAFGSLAAAAGFREDWIPYLLVLACVGLIVMAISMWKYTAPVLLCLLMAVPSTKAAEPPPAVPIAVATIVICVGGICVYKMVKVCQKKFPPKSTNSNGGFMATGTDEYAGAYEYSSIGSCWVPPDLNSFLYEDPTKNPTTFTLNINVQSGRAVTNMKANNDEGAAQTWDQFSAEMAGHGLYLTGHGQWQPQFAINGVPCDGASVPLEFDRTTGRVTHNTGGDLMRVVVERSQNMVDWSRLLQTDVVDGTVFQVVDTTRETQMFYRVQVTQP